MSLLELSPTGAVVAVAVAAVLVVAQLVGWAHRRLAAAERQRVALEAFKADLGVPAGRFRIVDISLSASVGRALRPWTRPPSFSDVHRIHPDADVQVELLAAVFHPGSGRGERP